MKLTPREIEKRRNRTERVLRDDEMVRTGLAYLADGEGVLCVTPTCTVAEFKRLIGAKEIRYMDFDEHVRPPELRRTLYPTSAQRRWSALAHADTAKAIAQGFRAALAMPRPTGGPA